MLNDKIQAVINMIPILKDSINSDVTISILADGCVQYVNHANSFKIHSNIGDTIPGNDPAQEVFRTGKTKHYTIPEEVFGVPIFGKLVPIFDDNSKEVVGVLASAYSMKRQYQIENSSTNLSSSLEQTEHTIEEYAQDIQNLANSLNEIQKFSQTIEEKVNEASVLITTIQGSASKSNILALNASIEAARAGEAGRGFTVVAKEMGKLAQTSSDMSSKISSTLSDMFKQLSVITKSVESANEVATTQAATIEEITATLESITAESEILATMAKEQ